MESENTHWRQLCPSIFDIEAGHGISKICCITLTLSRTYIPSPKSSHRGSVEGEESK